MLKVLEDDKKSKSSRSTPKKSNKALDFVNYNKTFSSEKLAETSKKIKEKNQLTSLTKIKS